MPKSSWIGIAASIVLLLLSACVHPAATPPISRRPPITQPPPPRTPRPSPQPQQAPEMAEVYKNVKVLHGPANRMDPVMKEFNVALGVQCNYCHLQNQWEQDIPLKEKARMMVNLSNHVNEEVPKGEVSCWTCHRGKPVPDKLPALAPESPETVIAVRAIGLSDEQAQQPVEKVFRNLKELGGFPAGNLQLVLPCSAFRERHSPQRDGSYHDQNGREHRPGFLQGRKKPRSLLDLPSW